MGPGWHVCFASFDACRVRALGCRWYCGVSSLSSNVGSRGQILCQSTLLWASNSRSDQLDAPVHVCANQRQFTSTLLLLPHMLGTGRGSSTQNSSATRPHSCQR